MRSVGGGGRIDPGFGGACRRAGIETFSPHDRRHTWATWHHAQNRDVKALMDLGGWRSVVMVMRCTHVNTKHPRANIDLLPNRGLSVHSGRYRA